MVKLIQKSGYIKSGGAGGYMKYIATRPRVENTDCLAATLYLWIPP